jgi:hypothetical protein
VVNEAGRQRPKYVANSQVKAALEGLAKHRRLRQLVDQITQLNLKLMKRIFLSLLYATYSLVTICMVFVFHM